MADCVWKGGAALAIADIWTLTFGGTLEVGDLFLITMGSKSFVWTCDTTSTTTAATNFAAAWNALSLTYYPEFREYTAADAGSGQVTLTASRIGVEGDMSASTTEGDGSPSDGQTFSATNTQPAEGPNHWNVSENWSSGTVPANGDDVWVTGNIPILYGLANSGVTLNSLNFMPTMGQSCYVGLPKHNGSYFEYRPDYLAVSATTVNVECKSGRVKLDTGSIATTLNVKGTGTPVEQDIPAFLWKGTSGSNVFTATRGSIGIAVFSTETSALASLLVGSKGGNLNDVSLWAGQGLTWTTIKHNGGSVRIASGGTTMTRNGGYLQQDAGNIATLNNWGGEWDYRGEGTVTTYEGGPGAKANLSADPRTRAITTVNLYAGTSFQDPGATVTIGAGKLNFIGCKMKDVDLDLGTNRVIAVT